MLVVFKKMWFAPGDRRKLDKVRQVSGVRYKKNQRYEMPEYLREFLPRHATIIGEVAELTVEEAAAAEAKAIAYAANSQSNNPRAQEVADPIAGGVTLQEEDEDPRREMDLARANSDSLIAAHNAAADEDARQEQHAKFRKELAAEGALKKSKAVAENAVKAGKKAAKKGAK